MANLGEGAQRLPDGKVLWVDLLTGSVFLLREGASSLLLALPGEVSRVLPAASGFIALGHSGPISLDLNFESVGGHIVLLDDSKLRLSDGTVLPDGSLVFGIVERLLTPGMGSLVQLTNDLEVRTLVEGASIPNGLAMLPDGDQLIWVDSPTRSVLCFDWDQRSSTLGQPHELFSIPDGFGIPDGLCVDSAGGIWIAMWGGGSVIRFMPSGEIDTIVRVDCPNVTSCAFDSHNRLIITSARVAMSESELAKWPSAGGIWMVSPDLHGKSAGEVLLARMDRLFE